MNQGSAAGKKWQLTTISKRCTLLGEETRSNHRRIPFLSHLETKAIQTRLACLLSCASLFYLEPNVRFQQEEEEQGTWRKSSWKVFFRDISRFESTGWLRPNLKLSRHKWSRLGNFANFYLRQVSIKYSLLLLSAVRAPQSKVNIICMVSRGWQKERWYIDLLTYIMATIWEAFELLIT